MLRVSRYGNENGRRVVFISPHSGVGTHFFNIFPDIHREFLKFVDPELLDRFIHIEADIGADQLALSSARSLSEAFPQLDVYCLSIEYPRGLLDGGRQPNKALRFLLQSPGMEGFHEQLLNLHKSTLDYIRRILSKGGERGLFIDVHSMGNFSPAVNVETLSSSSKLESYMEAFLSAEAEGGEKRVIDMISEDQHGKHIGCAHLQNAFETVFEKHGFEFCYNSPYTAAEGFMMAEYMNNGTGLAIDFPKHLLCTHPAPLDQLVVNTDKIDNLAHCLVEALSLCV